MKKNRLQGVACHKKLMFNVSILSVVFQYKVTKYNAPDCPMVGAECFPAIFIIGYFLSILYYYRFSASSVNRQF